MAGFNGFENVVVGQPFFNADKDIVNPIGSVLFALTYIFYDARLGKLEQSATFEYIQNTILKVAQRGYD